MPNVCPDTQLQAKHKGIPVSHAKQPWMLHRLSSAHLVKSHLMNIAKVCKQMVTLVKTVAEDVDSCYKRERLDWLVDILDLY